MLTKADDSDKAQCEFRGLMSESEGTDRVPTGDDTLKLMQDSMVLADSRPVDVEIEDSSGGFVRPVLRRGMSGGSSLLSGLSDDEMGGTVRLPWILTERAKLAVGAVVLLNAVAMSVEVEAELRFGRTSTIGLAMYIVQLVFLLVFTVELLLNIRCRGVDFFFRRGTPASSKSSFQSASFVRGFFYKLQIQGFFDLFVVLSSIVDLCIMRPMDLISEMSARKTAQAFSVFRILQLFRLARIFQLLRLSHELSTLAFNLAMSLKAVFWVFLLLFTLIYVGALFCASELGSSENEQLRGHFGNLWASIFAHFKLMTLEQWVDVCNLAMEESPLWAVYFLCFIILTNLTLVNLVTGLIITGVVEHAKEEDWTWLEQLVEETPFIEAVDGLVAKIREGRKVAKPSEISFEEFEMLLSRRDFQQVVSLYGISLQMEPRQLYDILDLDGNGSLEIQELAECLLQLRGSKHCLHPVLVRHEVSRKGQAFGAHVAELEEKLPQRYVAEVEEWERLLKEEMASWGRDCQRPWAASEKSSSGCSGSKAAETPSESASGEGGDPSPGTQLASSLLSSLHLASVSMEALRTKIGERAAELRSLQVQERRLEAELRQP